MVTMRYSLIGGICLLARATTAQAAMPSGVYLACAELMPERADLFRAAAALAPEGNAPAKMSPMLCLTALVDAKRLVTSGPDSFIDERGQARDAIERSYPRVPLTDRDQR
jgi:hypothetical protein